MQEIGEDSALHISWQLIENAYIIFITYGLVSIIGPFVFKVIFKSQSELFVDIPALIKIVKQTKELGKLITIIVRSINGLHIFNCSHEAAHYVGENGNSENQNLRYKQPFKITLGVEVAESNGRKS